MAQHHDLRDPARLFLEAKLWDEQELGPGFALEFVRLRELRKRILGGPTRPASEPAVHRPLFAVRNTGFSGNLEEKPPEVGTTSASASPLAPRIPAPTLDLPPWTDAQNVES